MESKLAVRDRACTTFCRRRRGPAGLMRLAVAGVAALCGCVPPSPAPSVSEVEDGNRGEIPPDVTGKTQGEPNGDFDSAILAVFNDDQNAALQGTVTSDADADVFDLGGTEVGDSLTIEARTPGSSLDVSMCLFDASGRLVYYNDDRSDDDFDSRIEHVARHAGQPYYLLVTASRFHAAGAGRGTYRVDVTVDRGLDAPAPQSQMLFLDFTGGTVDSPTYGGPITLTPFDAGRIHADYAGETDALKSLILQEVRDNYTRFDVTVVTSDDYTPQAGDRFTTLFFGGFAADIFGEAQQVDFYNVNCCDDAIIYTESFDPNEVFFRFPTTEQLGRAIGNVAAHEAGHVLGLNHTNDDQDIMDESSAADALTRDQEFMLAPLSRQISPIGWQDSALLLFETIGESL